jgi:hypothetical protein
MEPWMLATGGCRGGAARPIDGHPNDGFDGAIENMSLSQNGDAPNMSSCRPLVT